MSSRIQWAAPALVLLLGACGPPAPAPAPELSVPSWTDAAPAVRVQLDAAYARARAAPGDVAAVSDLGLLLHANRRLDAAAACYARAASLAPRDYYWSYLYGVTLEALGRSEEAAVALRRGIALEPRAIAPRLRLADLLAQQGELRASRALYEQILRRDPRNPSAQYGAGELLLAAGDARGAVPHFEAALQYGGDFGAAYRALAQAYTELGDDARATNELDALATHRDTLLPMDPVLEARLSALVESERSYVEQGMKLAVAGRVDEAIDAYRAALDRSPDNPRSHITLIGLYGAKGDLVRAEEHFRAAIAIDPTLPKAYFNIGFARLKSGRTDDAIDALEYATELDPQDAEARAVLGQAYASAGRDADAVAQYEQAIAAQPDHALARSLLVRALVARKLYAEAIVAGEPVGEGEARWKVSTLRELAAAHAELGELDRSFELLERASVLAAGDASLVAAVNADEHRYRARSGAPVSTTDTP